MTNAFIEIERKGGSKSKLFERNWQQQIKFLELNAKTRKNPGLNISS